MQTKYLTLNARTLPSLTGLLAFVALLACSQIARAQNTPEKLSIVSSAAPIHALLVDLTKGAQKPRLLLSPLHMPHGARLTPSQARMLEHAQLLVLIGDSFASFENNIKQTPKRRVVRLTRLKKIKKIQFAKKKEREHEEHDAHEHDEHEDEEHDAHAHKEHEHQEHEKHGQVGGIDPHLWLDPQNARIIVRYLADVLADLDQANAKLYRQNAVRIATKLRELDQDVAKNMRGLQGEFLMLHDATAYFVSRYKIKGQENLYGASHNATRDGMRHSLNLRKRLREGKYRCVFVQAQMPKELRDRFVGTATPIIEIDPLGSALQGREDPYGDLIKTVAQAFRRCLGEKR